MKYTTLSSVLIATSLLTVACDGTAKKTSSQSSGESAETPTKTTTVTDENYGLAETQVIFTDYVKKIAAATGSDGVGVFMHNKKGADPKDRTVMRINFDTLYSFAIVDLKEDLTLTMPETNGRYQSAWIITEEHYNPFSFEKPGAHKLSRENVGTRYAMICIRTQVNTADSSDVAKANQLQEALKLTQKDKGAYVQSDAWDMDEILKMRNKWMEVGSGISTDVMFGKKGEVPLKEHNAGTAYGWGGLTPKQAAYPGYMPTSTEPQTLVMRDVPVNAFWSVTVYDAEGYPQTDSYNINSAFAKKAKDGSVTIHFGGDKNADNYMEIFKGWNFSLRLYQPTEAYFDGSWKKPELKLAK